MNIWILITIILLGVEVARFSFGALVMLFGGKVQGKKWGAFMTLLNLANVAAIIFAFVILVKTYYGI